MLKFYAMGMDGAQQLTHAEEEILKVVAHDLRNPLMCIEGYATFLLENGATETEKKLALDRIISCCRWAGSIVGDLTDADAAERGQLVLKKELILLRDALRPAVDDFQIACRNKNVLLTMQISVGSGRVLADDKRIRQVLNNLLSNALKHVAANGHIRLSATEADGTFTISVADDGKGIDPAHQSRIFDKFYQVERDSRGSLGLGLFIAKAIVEKHDGRIWVHSEGQGRGATFCFTLPKFVPDREYAMYKIFRGQETPLPVKISERTISAPEPSGLGVAFSSFFGGFSRLFAFDGHSKADSAAG